MENELRVPHYCGENLFDNLGLRIKVELDPEYVMLRDKLGRMTRLRRWLSLRLRKRYKVLKLREQQAILNEVIRCS